MMSDSHLEAAFSVVADALALPPEDRERFVDEATSGNEGLRREVTSLLRAEGTSVEVPLFSDEKIDDRRRELDDLLAGETAGDSGGVCMPASIGGYRVLRRIGQGGMGVVYEAEQQQPRRKVALKLVDGVRAGTEFAARLRSEAEIQGRLQHPVIAQVFEAGVATVGLARCPFFAMELIEGRPILAYADDADLNLRERLSLLAAVGDGVGYAHDRGVVHRDLKPENILVKASGQPKVLDFGIASVTSDATIAATTMTRDGQILGTLAYIAPEQLGRHGDVTPRADVYALGVIAYELIAGRPPIDLGGLSISAAIRQIEMSEAPLLTSTDRSIPRDAATIVGACLDRDPARRYADGNALAADIRRYLDDRPIRARAPSRVDRSVKFVRRNRTLVGGVVATVLTLVVGIVVAGVLAAGQFRARLAAEASDRDARRQQARLVSRAFQAAADDAVAGRVIPAIKSLETVPLGLRGWGWDLLAASVPAWMPGSYDFGGLAFNTNAGTAWTGNRLFAVVDDGGRVLTVVDGTLVTWDPRTGEVTPRPGLGRYSRVEQVRHAPLPNVRAYDPDGNMFVLDTSTWSVDRAPDLGEPSAASSRYEPSLGAWMWLEGSGGSAASLGGGPAASISTRSHGPWAIELGADSDTDLPGWVDVRGLDERAVVSLYRESKPPYWFRFAVIDASSGEITARSERLSGSMSFVLLEGREEIAAARVTYPDREPAGGVVFLDAGTLAVRREIGGIAQPLAYLPDRDRLVVRLEDGTYRLMDPDGGRLDAVLLLSDNGRVNPSPLIGSMGVMHGGASVVAITDRPYRPLVIDTTDPQIGLRPLYHARPLRGALYHLAISPWGGLLAVMSPWQDEVAVVDTRTGETLALLPMRSSQRHRWHAMLWFSPDGTELLATVEAEDGSEVGVTRWNLSDGASRWTTPDSPAPINPTVPQLDPGTLPGGGPISSRHVVMSERDALLFTGSGESTIKRLDLASRTFEVLPLGTAEGIALSPDGQHLVAVATTGTRVIDIETGEVVARPFSDPDRLLCAAYSPDGSTLAVGSLDGRIFVVETEFYTLLYAFQSTPADDGRGLLFVHDLRWSPDSRTLYAAHAGGVITAWDARGPVERRELRERWGRADAAVAAGGSPDETGLGPEERAAAEVALVRQWKTEAPSEPPSP